MTDLKRLIDEVDSDLARAVLSSGRTASSNPARRKQVLAALGVGLVITTSNKLSIAALSTWQKVALIGGVACVGAGGAMTYTQLVAEPAAIVAPTRTGPMGVSEVTSLEATIAAPVEVPLGQGAAASEQTGAAAIEVVEPGSSPAAAGPRSASAGRTTSDKPSEKSSVKAELVLLEQARAALHGGNANAALQLLSRYGERYPRGNLRLEAEVLRVEALASAGRTSEAARLADRLLARNPKSVVASRLRRFASKD
jgi:hypothetical protein